MMLGQQRGLSRNTTLTSLGDALTMNYGLQGCSSWAAAVLLFASRLRRGSVTQKSFERPLPIAKYHRDDVILFTSRRSAAVLKPSLRLRVSERSRAYQETRQAPQTSLLVLGRRAARMR